MLESNGQEARTLVSSRKASTIDFEGILKQTWNRTQQDAATSGRSGEANSNAEPAMMVKQLLTPSLSQENLGSKGISDWIMECFKL